MSVRHRVEKVEGVVGRRERRRLVVFWCGRHEEMWRERVERARRRGMALHLIRMKRADEAMPPLPAWLAEAMA